MKLTWRPTIIVTVRQKCHSNCQADEPPTARNGNVDVKKMERARRFERPTPTLAIFKAILLHCFKIDNSRNYQSEYHPNMID
ncbi:MAG: hypothetical protein ABJN35_11125 [Erythrobacter sp.]